ncbi:MAG: Type-5 uracil-DNA glycosylase [Bryobacteraceae bacterium]|nr:Type-5 uracil-DNA glycosylase [Bryobacteraceae bacterium]
MASALNVLQQQVIACTRCPRLRAYCLEVARKKRRAYLDWEYWGKPVPAFGDPEARVMIIGLAPAAHGANRTGRMFTGDASGDFLYRVLYETGFASQAESRSRDDGMRLRDAWITASARCAPPDNKPTREELANCRPYLEAEIDLLTKVRVVVALGRIAFDTYLSILQDRRRIDRKSRFAFGHGAEHEMGEGLPTLIASYHPSQQNTSTGRLTAQMLRDVFERARELLGDRGTRSRKPSRG